MQIKLNNTPEQIELIKAMGSKNPVVAREAMEAVASLLVPVVREVLMTAGSVSRIYRDIEFDEDSDPSIPLDAFYGEGAGYVTVWSQSIAGGLPTSQAEGIKELKFGTYRLDTAFSFNKKYARKNRLDVISKYIERAINELLIKQERNGWAVVLKALAEAKTQTAAGTQLGHIITDGYASPFMLNVLNALMVRIKRINESYSGNTPTQPYSNGITDMFVSPEVKAAVRAFSYNPINTSATAATGAEVVRNQYVTDDLRNDIYKNAGMQSIYGVNLIELLEFGKGQKYNKLFDGFATASSVTNWASGGATTEIMVGIDNTRGVFVRPVAIQSESGGTISVLPDGQFDAYGSRVQKAGFYISLEEGRLCLDARAVAGAIVTSA
jgi:hypothetical protein